MCKLCWPLGDVLHISVFVYFRVGISVIIYGDVEFVIYYNSGKFFFQMLMSVR